MKKPIPPIKPYFYCRLPEKQYYKSEEINIVNDKIGSYSDHFSLKEFLIYLKNNNILEDDVYFNLQSQNCCCGCDSLVINKKILFKNKKYNEELKKYNKEKEKFDQEMKIYEEKMQVYEKKYLEWEEYLTQQILKEAEEKIQKLKKKRENI